MKSDAMAAFRAAAEVPDHRHDEAGPHRIACPVCGRGCRLNRRSGSLPRHRHYPGGPWCTLAGKRPLTQSEIAAAEDRERGPSDEDREACCAAQTDAETETETEVTT